MKPIIGIIARNETLQSGNKILYSYKEIVKKIKESNGIPIGINILNKTDLNTIELIDGIILQGGDTYIEEEIDLTKLAYKKNIPLLGICQGMQIMGIATSGEIIETKNHMKKDIDNVHEVIIKKDSKIYEILKKEKIQTNSRHNYKIINTTLDIVGSAPDNVIEVIEDKTKSFFIGVEWHPESLNNEDSKKIFDYFVKKASEYSDSKRNNKNNTWKNN